MKKIIFILFLMLCSKIHGQIKEPQLPIGSIRLSFLIFPPFTPLLTLEMRTFGKITVQLETNFVNTHGLNLKYFIQQRINGHFLFLGTAFLQNEFLRKDKNITFLPYIGYGYAYRFGKNNTWTFDTRLGIGRTLNADKNSIFPVLKTGLGKTF